jgi:citrate lyase gamma subunit
MPEPIAVMVDRTQPGEDTEAELMLVAVDEEGGCTLSLDDGGALDSRLRQRHDARVWRSCRRRR